MRPCPYSLAEILPHEAPMILLDEVRGYDENSLVAGVLIGEETLFADAQGVPAHVGIEYMAQACGAYAGAVARDAGGKVRVGYLLGTRNYEIKRPRFDRGERLTISATMVFQDEDMAVFDCRIEVEGEVAALARLNVYQPPVPLSEAGNG